LCYKWPWICSVCRNHNSALSSLMTYHSVCNKSNTNEVRVAQSLFFWVLFCRSLFVLWILYCLLQFLINFWYIQTFPCGAFYCSNVLYLYITYILYITDIACDFLLPFPLIYIYILYITDIACHSLLPFPLIYIYLIYNWHCLPFFVTVPSDTYIYIWSLSVQ
jgi:hypothetical protein